MALDTSQLESYLDAYTLQQLTLTKLIKEFEHLIAQDAANAQLIANTLEKFAGPLQWKWVNTHDRCRDWRVHFTLEGEALKCLEMNASNVRNSMDRVLYEDPEHPRHDGW